ncbi:ABC transporter substrate-binding protein [Halovivax gelatinilyticus]|uniref:ABC transporter substrate-binding protein n=1 Tax=Halovivax gelatinilyticus TaxID=2961597 RepID=UPI0020CA435C|nr:ABC transporter substrate-binding protein [Halovivax gelatinilyticus]
MSDRTPHTTRRTYLAATAGAASIAALAGCMGEDDSDAVVIGSNHPLTGDVARDGNHANEAVKLAAKHKNENGGIESLDGAEIEVVEGDNQGAQELGAEITTELVNDGADIVLGAVTSPATMSATQQADREQVPFVVTVGSDRDILTGRGLEYAYRPQPHQYGQAVDFAELHPEAIRNAGGTFDTIGLLYVDNTFGQETADGLRDHLPDAGVEIVEEQSYPFGPASLDTQITALEQADPDAISITSYVPGGQLAIQAMEEQDYWPDHIACCTSTTFADDDIFQELGDSVNGLTNTITTVDHSLDRYGEISDDYLEETGDQIGMVGGISYAATEVAIAAIEEAGSTDPDDVNEALSNIRVEDHLLAMPPIEFNDDGENENALTPVNQIQDMNSEIVSPEEYATSELQL